MLQHTRAPSTLVSSPTPDREVASGVPGERYIEYAFHSICVLRLCQLHCRLAHVRNESSRSQGSDLSSPLQGTSLPARCGSCVHRSETGISVSGLGLYCDGNEPAAEWISIVHGSIPSGPSTSLCSAQDDPAPCLRESLQGIGSLACIARAYGEKVILYLFGACGKRTYTDERSLFQPESKPVVAMNAH